MFLGEGYLSGDHRPMVGIGTKLASEPSLTPPEKLALARSVTRIGPDEKRTCFIAQCIVAIREIIATGKKPSTVRSIVAYVANNGFHILISGKEVVLVAQPMTVFQEDACAVIGKIFRLTDPKTSKVNKLALAFFRKQNREHLYKL